MVFMVLITAALVASVFWRRWYSAPATPPIKPTKMPTTGMRKNPATAPKPPQSMVELGMPACFSCFPGMRIFSTIARMSSRVQTAVVTQGVGPPR